MSIQQPPGGGRKTLGEMLRFLVAGGFRTIMSLVLYLALDYVLPYQVAFTIAFAVTVAVSAVLASRFVFVVRLGWLNGLAYAVAYGIHYALSLILLIVVVEYFGIPSSLAFLVMIPIMLPVGFLLERAALVTLGTTK